MKILLDTHAFLWFADGDPRISASARDLIERADRVLLSIASVWEGEIKRAAGRLAVPPLAATAARIDVDLLPVTSAHAEVAAHLPLHHRDPFDRMLVAQALTDGCVLVSKDDVIRRYGVPVSW